MSEIMKSNQGKLIAVKDLRELGEIANEAAGLAAFQKYRIGRAKNTIKRHRIDVSMFENWLRSIVEISGDMFEDPRSWQGVTAGLIEKYQEQLLNQGYAVSTVNAKISTIKVYAGLSDKAGALKDGELARIKEVKGFGLAQADNIDQRREDLGIDTRIGEKKASWTVITPNKADRLKDQPDTPQGRRDRLLMCLLLDHGLRCSEVELLKVENFDIEAGKFLFERPKVKATKFKHGKHKFSPDTWDAARAYIEQDHPTKTGRLLLSSRSKTVELKGGGMSIGELMPVLTDDELLEVLGEYAMNLDADLSADKFQACIDLYESRYSEPHMSKNAIAGRVRTLGEEIGLEKLSPHDCRHYCATLLGSVTKDTFYLMRFFGWSSPSMAIRYQESTDYVDYPAEKLAQLANGD